MIWWWWWWHWLWWSEGCISALQLLFLATGACIQVRWALMLVIDMGNTVVAEVPVQ